MKKILSIFCILMILTSITPLQGACAVTSIAGATVTITEPAPGERPDYNPVLPPNAPYYSSAFNTKYYQNDVMWSNATTNTSLLVNSDYFLVGNEYMINICLTPKDGYEFTSHSTGIINGNIVFSDLTYDGQLSLIYYFPALSYADGWQRIDGYWYFYQDGTPVTGWYKDGSKWYYFNSSGVMQSGWQKINGKWYYLGNDMKTGWQKISSKWYYFDASGVMQSGWIKLGGNWYYLGNEMKTGWYQVNGKWYYFNSDGVMQTGWIKLGVKWYYLGSEMKTGWQKISNKWYYFNSDGVMQTGWIKLGGKWYYLDNGAMVTGTKVIDGKTYTFDSNGVWKK